MLGMALRRKKCPRRPSTGYQARLTKLPRNRSWPRDVGSMTSRPTSTCFFTRQGLKSTRNIETWKAIQGVSWWRRMWRRSSPEKCLYAPSLVFCGYERKTRLVLLVFTCRRKLF